MPLEDPVLNALAPEGRARIEWLLAKQWSLPDRHALARLHGVSLGLRDAPPLRSGAPFGSAKDRPQDERYRLFVLLGPKNNVGSRYFQLMLADEAGRLGEEALALGLHSSGRFPAHNWIELTQYRAVQRFGDSTVDLATEGLDLALFEKLSPLAPDGGHMMVEYDSPSQRVTERVLTLGYPQATSPLGYLMFRVGCRSYRDWYISEGGREGPRKLQGFKPWTDGIACEKEERLRQELADFLASTKTEFGDEWGELARRTAGKVLAALDGGSP